MSLLIVPNVGKKDLLGVMSGASIAVPTSFRLYQNDLTPGPATVIGDFTVANFTGYANGVLAGVAVAGALDGSNRAVVTWNALTFTKNGATGNTIYGYYVTTGAGNLLWAERFDGAIPMTVNGAFIQITPRFTFKSEYSNV